jgi:16S rRNA (guanine527-N7)-methyltransferase
MIADEALPTPTQIIRFCAKLNRVLTENQALGISRYLRLLLKWNPRINLVGPSDWQTILADLVADSWHLGDFLQTLPLPDDPCTVDLGAGAGLPGIPLRLFWNAGDYHLVEIRQKRTAFLLQAVAALELRRTFVCPGRAEQALPALAPVDLCLSRAFMPWPNLLELVRPWLGYDGLLVVMAGQAPPDVLPPPWRLVAATDYLAVGKVRYFWALAAASISK